jgi:hypothetical protein
LVYYYVLVFCTAKNLATLEEKKERLIWCNRRSLDAASSNLGPPKRKENKSFFSSPPIKLKLDTWQALWQGRHALITNFGRFLPIFDGKNWRSSWKSRLCVILCARMSVPSLSRKHFFHILQNHAIVQWPLPVLCETVFFLLFR